jgi:hypothetical protein
MQPKRSSPTLNRFNAMQRKLPALATLQGLFNYNPLTGSIALLCDKGAKKAGDSAIAVVRGRPEVFVDRKYVRAADIAYMLAGGEEGRQQLQGGLYACCQNADLFDFRLSNLVLEDKPMTVWDTPTKARKRAITGRRRKEMAGIKLQNGRHVLRVAGVYLGSFDTKEQALAAKLHYLAQEN